MVEMNDLVVKEVTRETTDTVSISFEVPENLKETYEFLPGQYLSLETEIDGEKVRRSYSICTSPEENDLRVAVKQVKDGKFSTYANNDLKAGDKLSVMSPDGRFVVKTDKSNKKHYCLFAAGSGITPMMSILKAVLAEEPESEVTLFYGNRKVSSIIFRDELEDLKNVYMDRLTVFHVLSRENLGIDLYSGRIDGDKCKDFSEKLFDFSKADEFFMCGPFAMIQNVSAYLEGLNIEKSRIHFELFVAPDQLPQGGDNNDEESTPLEEGIATIHVIVDGDEYDFEMPKGGTNILDAATDRGLDVPFSCKGGVCCTCKALVLEGEVNMAVNYALEDEEVKQGYVLTCQAKPITDEVKVNFDV